MATGTTGHGDQELRGPASGPGPNATALAVPTRARAAIQSSAIWCVPQPLSRSPARPSRCSFDNEQTTPSCSAAATPMRAPRSRSLRTVRSCFDSPKRQSARTCNSLGNRGAECKRPSPQFPASTGATTNRWKMRGADARLDTTGDWAHRGLKCRSTITGARRAKTAGHGSPALTITLMPAAGRARRCPMAIGAYLRTGGESGSFFVAQGLGGVKIVAPM